jgi:hypothetical protein
MNREEWFRAMREWEGRGKEIENDYKALKDTLDTTYREHRAGLEKEISAATDDLIQGVDGASDRLEFAERTLAAVTKGYDDQAEKLNRDREGDLLGHKQELAELYKKEPLGDKAINNSEVIVELGKEGIQRAGEVTLPPIDVGGSQQWEALQESVKLILTTVQVLGVGGTLKLAADQVVGALFGDSKDRDRQTENMEHWIGEAQKKFDDKYKDAPAQQRESMQEKLDQNFDVLRSTLALKQELESPTIGGW